MDQVAAKKLADRLNWIPSAVMSLTFLSPMLLFWSAAFGPMRSDHLAPAPLSVALIGALSSCVLGALALLVDDRYFALRPVEKSGRLHESLGARWIRRVITNGDLINRHVRSRHPGYRVLRGDDALRNFARECDTAEKGHLLLFLGGVGSAAAALALGWNGWCAVLVSGNVISNLGPIVLQRYNRARLERIQRRPRKDRIAACAT